MKTLNLAQLQVEELTNQELVTTQGGFLGGNGGNGSLLSVGGIFVNDLVDLNTHVSGNSIGNGNSLFNSSKSSNSCGCH